MIGALHRLLSILEAHDPLAQTSLSFASDRESPCCVPALREVVNVSMVKVYCPTETLVNPGRTDAKIHAEIPV